jgi:bacillolysin
MAMSKFRTLCKLSTALPLFLAVTQGAYAADPLTLLQEQGAFVNRDPQTGQVNFIGTKAQSIALPQTSLLSPKRNSEDSAALMLQTYGGVFGLKNPKAQMQTLKKDKSMVRYQQMHKGVPIIGGELTVNMTPQNSLRSMGGEVASELSLETNPKIEPAEALDIAKIAVQKQYGLENVPTVTTPELSIYDPKLLEPSDAPTRLVWRMEVTPVGPDSAPIRELVLIDAQTGSVALQFNQIAEAKNRQTYTASQATTLPGISLCTEAADCTGNDQDAVLAQKYAGDTYDFYFNNFGRDSLNGAGLPLISSVHYGTNVQNAFWNGTQMIYGDGFSAADDVVAHELTHGLTQYTSNLFYYYQSGAINESLSDVFGELVDLSNGAGTDTPEVRWLIGEDIPGVGAIRSLSSPLTYNNPDKITSSKYYRASGDNGGVHINSGVNNKAAYLMTDGGAFNGKTVTGLGIAKVARIYYEVQTRLLTSGSNYNDLYNALNQGCNNLVGTAGITAGDCQQVRNAVDAVEMNAEPVAGFEPQAALCTQGKPTDAYLNDIEDRKGFDFANLSGSNLWRFSTGYASSGVNQLNVQGAPDKTDSVAAMNAGVTVPSAAFLHFKHAFEFESSYDGGVLEYTTDAGATWNDAGSLYDSGQNYTATLNSGSTLAGRSTFTGSSHGYVSSRYNLASLAGKNVRFRFRQASDSVITSTGWNVDDARIYTCGAGVTPTTPAPRADFNKDGNPDLLWRNKTTGDNLLWYMNGDGTNYISTANPPAVSNLEWDIKGIADFNKDGNSDIVWRNKVNGINVIWYMNADGSNYTSYSNPPAVSNLEWDIRGIADFNKDGNPDIVWRNKVNGINVIWYMNADGSNYISYSNPPAVSNLEWDIAGTADFNKDGNPDILWRNKVNGINVIWYMNGDGTNYTSFVNPPTVTPDWDIKGIADFNKDGNPDILWRNKASTVNTIWYMNGDGTNYISTANLQNIGDAWELVGPR